jgi:hypothetical protein
MSAEKFPLIISTGSIKYHLVCELVSRDRSFETFRIYAEKNQKKYIELTSNRPMLRAKGLKRKATHWEIKGDIRNQYTVDKAIKMIEAYLEPPAVKKRSSEPVVTPRPANRKKANPSIHWGEKNGGSSEKQI